MRLRKTATFITVICMVITLFAACSRDIPTNLPVTESTTTDITTLETEEINDDEQEAENDISIWDVLPEIPVTSQSAFKYEYSERLGGIVITDYLLDSGDVRIPDTIDDKPVVSIDWSKRTVDPFKEYNLDNLPKKMRLNEVIMPDTVKSFAFPDGTSQHLKYVNIPASMTEIEIDTFRAYSSLISVYIPEGITKIRDGAFIGCNDLTNINFPSTLESIGYKAFWKCTSLENIKLPLMVTVDESAFGYCSNLKIEFNGEIYSNEEIHDVAKKYYNIFKNIYGYY